MSNRHASWMLSSLKSLGIAADEDYSLILDDGFQLVARLRIRDVGDRNGMLIFDNVDFSTLKPRLVDIRKRGFGYSFFRTPKEGSALTEKRMAELLADWGWPGNEVSKSSTF